MTNIGREYPKMDKHMLKWIDRFKKSSSFTKNAIIALVIWAAPVILITIFCFARLDFVRSYAKPQIAEKSISK